MSQVDLKRVRCSHCRVAYWEDEERLRRGGNFKCRCAAQTLHFTYGDPLNTLAVVSDGPLAGLKRHGVSAGLFAVTGAAVLAAGYYALPDLSAFVSQQTPPDLSPSALPSLSNDARKAAAGIATATATLGAGAAVVLVNVDAAGGKVAQKMAEMVPVTAGGGTANSASSAPTVFGLPAPQSAMETAADSPQPTPLSRLQLGAQDNLPNVPLSVTRNAAAPATAQGQPQSGGGTQTQTRPTATVVAPQPTPAPDVRRAVPSLPASAEDAPAAAPDPLVATVEPVHLKASFAANDLYGIGDTSESVLATLVDARASEMAATAAPGDPQALDLLRKAADLGDATAEVELGRRFAAGQGVAEDDAEAVAWYRRAADAGDGNGQLMLAIALSTGKGVAADDTAAVTYLSLAAAQGVPMAQNMLGARCQLGQGVLQDAAQAADWYRKAAAQNFPDAQYNLGALLAQGVGTPRDFTQAYAWFTLAAQNFADDADRAMAAKARDMTASQLSPADLEAARRLVSATSQKPATAG